MTAAHDGGVVGVRALRRENKEKDAVEDQVEGDHHAVADQNLEQAVAEMIAERIKIPAQKAARKEQHVQRSGDVDDQVDLKVGGAGCGRKRIEQQRQQPDMEREIKQGGDELALCHAAGEARGIKGLSVHCIAFRCSV